MKKFFTSIQGQTGVGVDKEAMARALSEAGYRLTQPRLAVLQVLLDNDEYLSPYEIYERGKTHYERLGLVTVYRTLQILSALDLARRVHTKGHCHGYARAGADKHYLVCRGCGQVVEFPCPGMDLLVESAQQQTGYLVEEHLLELAGLCPDCQ